MRPANWKEVKNCWLSYGMIFAVGRDFIVVSTDYSLDVLHEALDADADDEIVSLVIVKLPKTFEEFRERYAYIDWDTVRKDLDANEPHSFSARLREMRFAKGKKAACLFTSMLEDAQGGGLYLPEDPNNTFEFVSVSPIKAGDMKRIFDPSYKGST